MPQYSIGAKLVVTKKMQVSAKSVAEAKAKAVERILGETGIDPEIVAQLESIGLEFECVVVHQLWDLKKVSEEDSECRSVKTARKKTNGRRRSLTGAVPQKTDSGRCRVCS